MPSGPGFQITWAKFKNVVYCEKEDVDAKLN